MWESLKASAIGEEGKTVVLCPASANPCLEGELEVDAAGFTARIGVCAVVEPTHREQLTTVSEGRLAAFRHGLDIVISGVTDTGAIMEVQAVHPEKPELRISAMLNGLWDLQLAAVTVLEEVFGMAQAPPDIERRQSVLQSLADG